MGWGFRHSDIETHWGGSAELRVALVSSTPAHSGSCMNTCNLLKKLGLKTAFHVATLDKYNQNICVVSVSVSHTIDCNEL